ncbi:At2g23090 like protein [Pavlovales sp. CCMP2436]|nr:At2g23090 like protein [Pavlovales sp. CCMP2436]
MARGMQKVQAQAKNAAAKAKASKPTSNMNAFAGATKYQCPVCLVEMTSLVSGKEHFDSKHPKDPRGDPETWKKVEKK